MLLQVMHMLLKSSPAEAAEISQSFTLQYAQAIGQLFLPTTMATGPPPITSLMNDEISRIQTLPFE